MAAEAQVEYNFLSGNCGVKVSNLCLGTMVFGKKSALLPPDQLVNYETTVNILDRFTELGGNFIDTANMYCDGSTEEFIGDWMAGKEREKIVLATKCRFSFGEVKGIMPGLSRKAIMFNVEESLKRLKTDYIDLYQIHCWDNAVPLEETLSTLNDLVRAGKVHYLGGSNLVGWQLQEIYDINEKRNYAQFVTLQQLYNILDRQSELEPFEVCRNKGLGILPYSPLKGGLLTGKHKRDTGAEPGSRIDLADKVNLGRISEVMPKFGRFKDDEGYWKLDELLHSLANKYGKTVAQVSLRWLLQKPNVNSVIIGGKTVKQIEDNMGAGKGWQLSNEDMKEIDDLSALKKEYPYREVEMFNGDRLRTGCSAGRQF